MTLIDYVRNLPAFEQLDEVDKEKVRAGDYRTLKRLLEERLEQIPRQEYGRTTGRKEVERMLEEVEDYRSPEDDGEHESNEEE